MKLYYDNIHPWTCFLGVFFTARDRCNKRLTQKENNRVLQSVGSCQPKNLFRKLFRMEKIKIFSHKGIAAYDHGLSFDTTYQI